MAKVKTFTDASGVEHPLCYWRPVQYQIDAHAGGATITMLGYHDKACRDAGKSPVADAQKQVSVSGEQFLALFTRHLTPGGPNIAALAYEICVLPDADGSPSYFVDALDG